ncbi:LOW QUALITY PROTEIN: Amyloid-beta A4 precursor protein-binding family A member 2, partial [Plecturocebus cupreus]
MAHWKRESAGSSMLDYRARPGPVPHNQERRHGAAFGGLWAQGPGTGHPAAREPHAQGECHNHSPDGDSSSNYVNNNLEEEDYDEGLPKEEEGITYYICYCPKDNSYLEGMDCNGDEYLVHGMHPMDTDTCQGHPHNIPRNWTTSAGAVPGGPWLSGPSAPFPGIGESYSGTGEEWLDSVGLYPHGHCAEGSQDYPDGYLPILENEPSVLDAHDQEEDGYYHPSKEGYQDCYPTEANRNTSASHYHLRHGDGDLEGQEEDIDPIMAKITRSLSMTSITSA